MLSDREKELKNLKHIQNILEERTLWFKKRQLETKRAMKSMHRLNILPEPIETHIMIEADIIYMINLAGIKSLQIILSQFANQEISFNKTKLRKEFKKQLFIIDDFFESQNISNKQISDLFNVVFSLDEEYQRKIVAKFILKFVEYLINRIFKNIVILDELYTKEVIENLTKYMQNRFT